MLKVYAGGQNMRVMIAFLLVSFSVLINAQEEDAIQQEMSFINDDEDLSVYSTKNASTYDVYAELSKTDEGYTLQLTQKDGTANTDGCGYRVSDMQISPEPGSIGLPEKNMMTGTINVDLSLPLNSLCPKVVGQPRTVTINIEEYKMIEEVKYKLVINGQDKGIFIPGYQYKENSEQVRRRR